MPDFHDQNHQTIFLYGVDDSVVTGSDFMKIVLSLHLGQIRIRQILGCFLNLFLDADQIPLRETLQSFQYSGTKLYIAGSRCGSVRSRPKTARRIS